MKKIFLIALMVLCGVTFSNARALLFDLCVRKQTSNCENINQCHKKSSDSKEFCEKACSGTARIYCENVKE